MPYLRCVAGSGMQMGRMLRSRGTRLNNIRQTILKFLLCFSDLSTAFGPAESFGHPLALYSSDAQNKTLSATRLHVYGGELIARLSRAVGRLMKTSSCPGWAQRHTHMTSFSLRKSPQSLLLMRTPKRSCLNRKSKPPPHQTNPNPKRRGPKFPSPCPTLMPLRTVSEQTCAGTRCTGRALRHRLRSEDCRTTFSPFNAGEKSPGCANSNYTHPRCA